MVGAVIVAAGRSARMGGIDKIVAPLAGRPLLLHTLAAFEACAAVQRVVVVTATDRCNAIAALIAEAGCTKVVEVVPGGARRQDSVRAGLERLTDVEIVAVHDGARPLVTPALIAEGVSLAERTGAAVAAWPVAETLKRADASGRVQETIPRDGVWLIQTPQVFRRELLLAAYAATDADVTDDAMLVERLGQPVYLYRGAPENIKVTTPSDLTLAEALLRLRGAA